MELRGLLLTFTEVFYTGLICVDPTLHPRCVPLTFYVVRSWYQLF